MMKTVLKILKINFLSLIAIILYIIAYVSKLIKTFLDRILLMKHVVILLGFVLVIYETIVHLDEDTLGAIIVITLFAGGLIECAILLLSLFGVIAFASLAYLWFGINYIFSNLYILSYSGVIKLTNICRKDFDYISLSGNKIKNSFFCIVYYLSKGIKKFINLLSLGGIVIAVVFGCSFAVLLGIFANNYSINKLNRNVFQAFIRLDAVTNISNVASYLIIVIGFFVLAIAIGSDMRIWSKNLNKPVEIKENVNISENNNIPETYNKEEFLRYRNMFYESIQDIEILSNEINGIFNVDKNTDLIVYWNEYLCNIIELCSAFDSFNKKGKVPRFEFQSLIPKIRNIENQHNDIVNQIKNQKKKMENPLFNAIFFSGCDTIDKLERRHKILCKAYHPDAGGDEETFKKMQSEYEDLKIILEKQKEACFI